MAEIRAVPLGKSSGLAAKLLPQPILCQVLDKVSCCRCARSCVDHVSSVLVSPSDVGRSCILVSMGGKNIMLDCGMHMGFNDEVSGRWLCL